MFGIIESSDSRVNSPGLSWGGGRGHFPTPVERCPKIHDNPKLLLSQELCPGRSLQRRLSIYLTPFTALMKAVFPVLHCCGFT